jgi:bacteriocin-like protein
MRELNLNEMEQVSGGGFFAFLAVVICGVLLDLTDGSLDGRF